MTDLEVVRMSDEAFRNEKLYNVTMLLVKKMLHDGTISKEEYDSFNAIFTKKYNPSLSTLFAEIGLI